MNAESFDPAAISVTPAAQAHMRRQIAKRDGGASALLLGISERGCNGYMYDISYVDDAPDGVRVFDFDGITVLVEDAHWALVRGTEIDYVTEGLNSALAFRNPNADAECGCGESFSVRASG